jgi:hypothetical protein
MELFAPPLLLHENNSEPISNASTKGFNSLTTRLNFDKSIVGTFSELGLCRWVCDSAAAMGLKRYDTEC